MTVTVLLQQVTLQLSCERSGLLTCCSRVSDCRPVEEYLREFVSSGSPQTFNGKGTRCVATLSINNVAAKRNRQEDLKAEHKTCGIPALRKSIAGFIERRL
jgi:hypothetical protein